MLAIFAVSSCALAQENLLCDKIDVIKSQAQQAPRRYTLKQLEFADAQKMGADLAIVITQKNQPTQIKRATFGRGVAGECSLKPIAFEMGGDWGWHMLWAEAKGLLYARMDGEAWVSSNPKYLTKLAPIHPRLSLTPQTLTIRWQQVENGVTTDMQAISNDEGRSWDIQPIP